MATNAEVQLQDPSSSCFRPQDRAGRVSSRFYDDRSRRTSGGSRPSSVHGSGRLSGTLRPVWMALMAVHSYSDVQCSLATKLANKGSNMMWTDTKWFLLMYLARWGLLPIAT